MRLICIALACLVFSLPAAYAGGVLDRVKARGTLSCGVLIEPEDFTKTDVHGMLDDLGSDLCRSLAAAVLGDAGDLTFASLADEGTGFRALRDGTVDVVFGASPSDAMALVHGLRFGPPVFFDSMSFLVNRHSNIHTMADLADKQVCFIGNTPAEQVLGSETLRRHLHVMAFPFEEEGEMNVALLTGHCDAVVSSLSRLASTRASFHGRIDEFEILADRLALDPVAPAMRADDPRWASVVDGVVNALFLAEAAGVTAKTVDVVATSEDAMVRPLNALIAGIDASVLDRGWARRAIAAVGNYGEIYERDCGPKSPLGLPRGYNALWTEGGLIYPEGFR